MIRRAEPDEHVFLTEISFSSKAVWEYPEEYFQIWEKELTISPDYISQNEVYVYEWKDGIAGYYSVAVLQEDQILPNVIIEAGLWLEHMFVSPHYLGLGIGRELFRHCLNLSRRTGADRLKILADPNARGFYERIGCRYLREYPSTIEGRTTPCLEYLF